MILIYAIGFVFGLCLWTCGQVLFELNTQRNRAIKNKVCFYKQGLAFNLITKKVVSIKTEVFRDPVSGELFYGKVLEGE